MIQIFLRSQNWGTLDPSPSQATEDYGCLPRHFLSYHVPLQDLIHRGNSLLATPPGCVKASCPVPPAV
jgi:hypothetical protein